MGGFDDLMAISRELGGVHGKFQFPTMVLLAWKIDLSTFILKYGKCKNPHMHPVAYNTTLAAV